MQTKQFFRRPAWNMMQDGAKPPVWHRLAATEPGVLIAMCGYRFEWLFNNPQWKEEIKTAKLRCKKCDKKAGIK